MVRRENRKKQGKLKDAKFVVPNIDVEEEDEAVFDLNIDENDEENSENTDDNELDNGADGSDDEVSEDEELLELVEKLPAKIRQKVLSGNAELSDDNDDDDAPEDEGWGKKKKVYWTGDTADLEIGQDMADAEDEEDAALELQRERQSKLTEGDFYDDDVVSDGGSDEEKDTIGHKLRNFSGPGEAFTGPLESISLSKKHSVMEVEEVPRDISQLSSEQKRALLHSHSPELLGLAAELRDRASELRERFLPIQSLLNRSEELRQQVLQSLGGEMEEVVQYVSVRQEALLCYCLHTAFYLHLRARGRPVGTHPVMKQLLRMRYLLEKMRPLDARLQPQIERLLRMSAMSEADLRQQARLRPDPAALLGRDDDEEDEDEENDKEEEEEDRRDKRPSEGLYRAPRISSAPYRDRETVPERQQRDRDAQRRRLKNSELVQALQEEFGEVPERQGSGGGAEEAGSAAQRMLEAEREERRAFEEDRFVRTSLSRADKKTLRQRTQQAGRLDNFEDIGDAADLDRLLKASNSSKPGGTEGTRGKGPGEGDVSAAKNMRKALGSLVEKKSQPEKEEDNEFDRLLAGKRERDSDGQEEGDLLEQFARRKKEFIAQKKALYVPEPRYGGIEQAVEEGERRPASYEIIKNKGLTPHRKKANRNPRVKKREMFDKKLKARKGQVREVLTGRAGSYAGESTGIKANISKSRRIV